MGAYRREARTMLGQQGARHDWTERNSTVRDRNEERTREALLRYPYCYGGNPGIYHARMRAIQLDMGHYNLDSVVSPYCERELRCPCELFGDGAMPSGIIRSGLHCGREPTQWLRLRAGDGCRGRLT